MKIIHTADIHLGSKLQSRFPKSVADSRREEVRSTFKRLVQYASENGIKIILLSGDVFDSDHPFKKDKEFFYSIVKSNPDVNFIYLRGNHDIDGEQPDEIIENLKTFSDGWTCYDFGCVTVSGIEMTAKNATALYSSLNLSRERINIVMLHGQTGDTCGKDKINLKKLANKNIDYLALGHIHKPQSGVLDERGEYAYSGCIEGRGFDETGIHGFELIKITDRKLNHKFVPFSERAILEYDVCVTGAKDAYSAYLKIKEKINLSKRDIYRINMTGELSYDVEELAPDVEKFLSSDCMYASVKDKTRRTINIDDFIHDLSLKGEFVRTVYSDNELSEDEKLKIITCGLRALGGGDIEL